MIQLENLKMKFFKTSGIKNLKDIEAINQIRKDKIDIIIDLNGLSSDHRWSCLKIV